MNSSTLRNLGIVLFALIAILVGLQLADDGAENPASGEPLFPELKNSVNAIERVSVERYGEEPLVVRRDDGRWIVDNRGGYSADLGKLRELLLELADAQILERKTANPERYAALGVRDIDVEGSAGTGLTLNGGDSEFAVIIGNSAPGNERYARIVGETGSVLINKSVDLPASAGDWLATEIVDIAAADVQSVAVAHDDGESIRVSKASREMTDFSVTGVPTGRELSYPTVANSIGGALSGLTLEDVRRAGDAEATTVTTVTTFDGLVVTASLFNGENDEHWVGFTATAMPIEEAAAAPSEGEEPAEGEGGVDITGSVVDAAEQAEAINVRVAGWQYRLPTYKANQLIRRWDDLLKSEEAADE